MPTDDSDCEPTVDSVEYLSDTTGPLPEFFDDELEEHFNSIFDTQRDSTSGTVTLANLDYVDIQQDGPSDIARNQEVDTTQQDRPSDVIRDEEVFGPHLMNLASTVRNHCGDRALSSQATIAAVAKELKDVLEPHFPTLRPESDDVLFGKFHEWLPELDQQQPKPKYTKTVKRDKNRHKMKQRPCGLKYTPKKKKNSNNKFSSKAEDVRTKILKLSSHLSLGYLIAYLVVTIHPRVHYTGLGYERSQAPKTRP
jgi:hypothetical protein